MTRKWNYIIAIIGGLLSIPVVFAIAYMALHRMVLAEYASGERTSTAGDTVTIPAAGITAAWVVTFAIGAFVVLAVRIMRRRRG
jgi:TRAP-type mannitol/chloroaromatic compound transport system permease small subunit